MTIKAETMIGLLALGALVFIGYEASEGLSELSGDVSDIAGGAIDAISQTVGGIASSVSKAGSDLANTYSPLLTADPTIVPPDMGDSTGVTGSW